MDEEDEDSDLEGCGDSEGDLSPEEAEHTGMDLEDDDEDEDIRVYIRHGEMSFLLGSLTGQH